MLNRNMLDEKYFIKNGIEVLINDMKDGKILYSRNYSICNAIVFTDNENAALAHISKATSPELLMKGYVSGILQFTKNNLRKIKTIKEIFGDNRVIAYHIFRIDGCWSSEQVMDSLNYDNIEKIIEIPVIYPEFRTRTVAVTINTKEIYIFPKSYSEKKIDPIIIKI